MGKEGGAVADVAEADEASADVAEADEEELLSAVEEAEASTPDINWSWFGFGWWRYNVIKS